MTFHGVITPIRLIRNNNIIVVIISKMCPFSRGESIKLLGGLKLVFTFRPRVNITESFLSTVFLVRAR